MSARSEARTARRLRDQAKQERRAKPADRATVRFDYWRRIVANLPAGLADAETEQMVALINSRINAMEGGNGQ